MTIETIIGFDSAWTNKVSGAICMITHDQGRLIDFRPPHLVQFEEATELVKQAEANSDFTLVGLDQPTLVPNHESMRPVERVAGSIVNAIKGGVQPANRGRENMFGDGAPVWDFLDHINARENPGVAKEASSGLFLIEVFPALALPSMVPAIWQRRRAAKYNPGNRKTFQHPDWELVTTGLMEFARQLDVAPIVDAGNEFSRLQKPTKSDQDKLDALICLAIAWTWRHQPRDASMVLGDNISGYMVTPVSNETAPVLIKSAQAKSVPVNAFWAEDAHRTISQSIPTKPKKPPTRTVSAHVIPFPSKGSPQGTTQKKCPECGFTLKGKGWGGIDAHWKANHENIMPYSLAWPLIKAGKTPS